MKTEKQLVSDFKKAVRALRKVVSDAKSLWPDAQLYLASGTLNLMKGEHHSEPLQKPRYDNTVCGIIVNELDGGDW